MSEEQGLTPYETREILFYKTENGEVRVEILLFQENLWLTQAKMAELFEVQKAAISKHMKNIFESGELSEMCIRDSPLSLVAGNQAVADIFLQGGDVLRVEQTIQKFQPEDRFRSVGVVGHGEAVSDNFRLSLCKGSVQKKCAVGKMNPIRLRGKILHQRRQFHQLHNVADFAGNVADRTAFQLLKNFSSQG